MLFIHGILDGVGGTCTSLPVLYAAVGRRLGYPIKLVAAMAHMFCRWDDPISGERFNIETAAHGFVSHPDEHYHEWPFHMPSAIRHRGYMLRSLTAQEELAHFYVNRARSLFRLVDVS